MAVGISRGLISRHSLFSPHQDAAAGLFPAGSLLDDALHRLWVWRGLDEAFQAWLVVSERGEGEFLLYSGWKTPLWTVPIIDTSEPGSASERPLAQWSPDSFP